MGGRPTIVGPAVWHACAPPPRFDVDTGGPPLFVVELASAQGLMAAVADRTDENYFFGGDADSAFATGHGWCVPEAAWSRLRDSPRLFYRIIAFDQAAGTARPSVDDGDLARLPSMVVDGVGSGGTEP